MIKRIIPASYYIDTDTHCVYRVKGGAIVKISTNATFAVYADGRRLFQSSKNIKIMNKKEKIIKWLKSNGVFESFCKNTPNQKLILNEFLITEHFVWDDSPEGFSFWSKIHLKYSDWYYKQFPNEFIDVNFHEIK